MYLEKIKLIAFILLFPLLILSCSKGGGGGGGNNPPPAPTEENLIIGIDPDPGLDFAKALGSSYTFKLQVKSKMPPQGIEGTVVFRKESDNSVVSSQNIGGTTANIDVIISGIDFNMVGIVTIDVKSKSKATNTASKTFKLHRK